MELSEAIKLGAMMKPQYFNHYTNEAKDATCALGAAYDAIGKLDILNDEHGVVDERVDWTVITVPTTCPACAEETLKRQEEEYRHPCNCGFCLAERRRPIVPRLIEVGRLIVHLNDNHRWTREHIADFVATIEAREAGVAALVAHAPPVEVAT